MSKIIILQDRCKSCRFCAGVCKKGLISVDTSVINILGYHPVMFKDTGECTGCAMCAEVCPEVAIEVWRSARGGEEKSSN